MTAILWCVCIDGCSEWMFLYVLVEDIKNRLKLFNNTHIFDPYIQIKNVSVVE